MADNILIIEVEYDGKKGFAKLNKDSLKAGEQAGEDFGGSFAKTVGAVFSGNLLADAVKKGLRIVSDFVKESVAQAVEAEQAQLQLANSLKRVGGFTEENINFFNSFAQTLQKTTSITDEQAISLVKIANNYARSADQAKALVQAALDLEAATGANAQQSIEALGNSLNGVARGLQTLIPGFRVTSEEALKSGAALQFVNQQFGGKAQADYAGSAAGLSKLAKGFAEIQEATGRLLTNSEAVRGFVDFLGKAFFRIAEAIDNAGPKIDAFASAFATFSKVALAVVTADLSAFETKVKDVNSAMGNIDPDLEAFMQLNEVMKADKFTAYSAGINQVKTDLDLAREKLFLFGIDLANINTLSAEQVTATFNAALALQSYGLTIGVLNGLTQQQTLEYANLVEQLHQAGFSFEQLNDMSLEELRGLQKNFAAIGSSFKQHVVAGIVQGTQAITKALINNENAFDAFLSTVLNIMGDMLIQIGGSLIAIGLGIEAIKMSIIGLTGGPALAAGLALVILGTLLKSLSSGGGGGAQNVGGGDFGTGGGVAPGQTDVAEQEREKPKTEVTINVQGNVLDRRESGLAIAEVLQEYFDTNDGVLAKA